MNPIRKMTELIASDPSISADMRRALRKVLDCPVCASSGVEREHHDATFAVPECDYWRCQVCDATWGYE